MRDDERSLTNESPDNTIAQLLTHLQQLRRSVPINYQLKTDLKEKLLQRMRELDLLHSSQPHAHTRRKRRIVWWLSCGAIALSLAVIFGVWSGQSLEVRDQSLLTLPTAGSIEQVDISANGNRLAYVSEDAIIHTRSLDGETNENKYRMPATDGHYEAITWANNNGQLAIVEATGEKNRLWLIDMPEGGAQGSTRLISEETKISYRSPNWAPNNEEIAYTRVDNGNEEIWVNSTISLHQRKIIEGSQPTWSPDGKTLAFVKNGSVSLIDLASGEVKELGHGGWPSWETNERVTYTTSEGQLAETRLDVSPPETNVLLVGNLSEEKIVRASWTKGRNHLLIAQEANQVLVFSLATR